MPICSKCDIAYLPGEPHTCDDGLRPDAAPTHVEYATVGLLLVIVTAGSFPLIRGAGNRVFGAFVILLLWVGLPVAVNGLLRAKARWFAAAANACTMLSAAIWPDPQVPNKLADSFMWWLLAAMAAVSIVISLIVSAVYRHTVVRRRQ